ncbi:MAG: phosphopantetheine-binding protein [Methylophilaceae bacterium]|jgi:acyl carrier protein|nr:phosphopantetheine-binding protein [Methylophilales bacterium]
MTTPTLDEVAQALSQMVADKMDIDVASIKADSSLQSLGLDSLDTFDLIFSAEDHFKIKVPNDQIKIETLHDVSVLVHKLTIEQNK